MSRVLRVCVGFSRRWIKWVTVSDVRRVICAEWSMLIPWRPKQSMVRRVGCQ